MNTILTFLLIFFYISCLSGESTTASGGGSGEQFSWDSSDEETASGVSYSGVVVQVYKAEGEGPSVTLGTDKDGHETIYCFNFLRTFEALNYDLNTTTDATYEEISDSSVDLAKVNCTASEQSTTQFTISCEGVNDGTLSFIFKFTQNADGDYGLEYTVNVEDYTFVSSDSSAQLVMVQSLKECNDKHPYSADSDSNDGDDGTTEESVDDTSTTPEPVTRRLLLSESDGDNHDHTDDAEEESDSKDEEDGISSDDSNEFDAGYIKFVVDGQAYDKCAGQDDKSINSGLIYQTSVKELHIVFEHFECDLSLDPFVGIDESLIDSSAAYQIMIAIIMGFVFAFLF